MNRPAPEQTGPDQPLIRCQGLNLRRGATHVLGPIDLGIAQGAITAICGPNGSGKTTLLNALTGVLAPHSGQVLFAGQPIGRLRGRALGRQIAVLRQHQDSVSGLSLRELVAFGRFPHRGLMQRQTAADRAAITAALEMCGLETLAGRDMAALSGGERQRAWLALALAQEPRVLILDEPTSYLDVRYQVEILSLLKGLNRDTGLTILAVLHDLDQVLQLADAVVLLRKGQLFAAGPAPRVMTTEILREVYDLPLSVETTAPGRASVRIDWLGALA
ncbi:ABC transporter ATP-binding protein [Xinfangfangia sp. D13-10-4-6]|uniref:ABC transporter ATP-binding protein n=1 Tax=Pseudogemmobacter hezensis TaxID=2737662 RepID=UPI0015554941|nr:ABC transporter ATP-binding protein [Pseudogemmobacter hezensis]NPD14739.1 ABC transporter ATP-binding protein [Pseudogemmobacter hezensis]